MINSTKKEWFCNWFDTPYYGLLYKHRNDEDAALFIDALLKHLALKEGSSVLDMPCGKGRHSVYLNKKGFDVTGLDLSKESVKSAKEFENETLSFYTHDMRNLFRINYFDLALNLFTSMGYFKYGREDEQVIKVLSASLKNNGIVVIDFMNAAKTATELLKEEHKTIEGVDLKIERTFENNIFVKKISVTDSEKNYVFYEKVKALKLEDFERYFSKNRLIVDSVFGNYNLDVFDVKSSERLIVMGRKK